MLNKAVSGHQHHDTLLGEPGTQLTMRTFHIGGTASRVWWSGILTPLPS